MTPRLLHVGRGQHPVVVIDDFSGDPDAIVAAAAALAPFPPPKVHYPGVRRVIGPGDGAAHAYAERTLEAIGPFVAGAFDADRYDWIEASFSIVTTPPAALTPVQRAPHFDSTDPGFLAVLHYLSDTPGTGTAFYRQRSTWIEAVSEANLDRFVGTARRESVGGTAGYITDSTSTFERIGAVDGRRDRLIIYRGCLLHSGIVPPDMVLSPDPRTGRLTANFFIQVH